MMALLLSMAGIPPFAGFYAKYFILLSVYLTHMQYFSFYIAGALVSSAVLLLVYLQLVVDCITSKTYKFDQQQSQLSVPTKLTPSRQNTNYFIFFVLNFFGLAVLLFFDFVLMLNSETLGGFAEAITEVYFFPSTHFSHDYVHEY